MTYKIYFTKDCYIEVVCDSLQVFSFDDFGSNHDVLRCLNNSEIFLEVDFSHVIRVVEICFDAIEVYEKDVTEELRLQCKSSRGEGTGGQRSSSRDNDLMDFGDFFERIFIVLCDIGLVISGLIFLWLFLSKFLGGDL